MFRLIVVVRSLLAVAVFGAVLFGAAGRLDLPFFWAYLAVLLGLALFALLTLSRELLDERVRPPERGRDNLALLRAGAGAAFAAQWIVAGVDVGRLHVSDSVPPALQLAGLAGFVLLFTVWIWAMRSNPFFSVAVRVQRERGHRVVSSGPYHFVRHPGYAAFILLGWSGALALGSWWAALPHALIVVLFVRRTALEDRMLREELEGYADYAARVRYRLIPGIW